MRKNRNELIQDLDRVNLWIGNCDQKASFLLAMVGVASTIICTSDFAKLIKRTLVRPFVIYWQDGLGDFNLLRLFILLFLLAGLGCLFAAFIYALLSLMAKTNYEEEKKNQIGMEEKTLLHFSSIANMEYQEFISTDNDIDNDI